MCKYCEVLTEIQAQPRQIDDYGNYEAEPVEVAIGEYCHYHKDYNCDCDNCDLPKALR